MSHAPEFPAGPRKVCTTCGSLIPVDAAKYTTRDTYQDWRKYVNFSTTMVALITALISVIATAAPTISNLFRGHDSALQVAFQGGDHFGGINILASNIGDRPGGISDVTLTIPKVPQTTPKSYPFNKDEINIAVPSLIPMNCQKHSSNRMKANKSTFLLHIPLENTMLSDLDGGELRCKIFKIAEFSGKENTVGVRCRPCRIFSSS